MVIEPAGPMSGTALVEPAARGIHGAAEAASRMMIEGRAVVAARHDHQRAVVEVAVVEIDAGRQDVVIGMGIEGPVLMPFDGRAVARRLHVELAAMLADRRPEQLRQDRRDGRVPDQPVEELVALEQRGLEPPHARQLGVMAGLEIVEVVALVDAAGIGDDPIGEGAKLGQLLAPDQAGDHQVAVASIGFDLSVGKHTEA
jgi:hypothetical protein